MKKFALEFDDPEAESRYRQATASARKLQMRLGLLMPAVLYVLFGFIDPLILPEFLVGKAQLIHIGQGMVFGLLVLISLRIDSMRYHVAMVAGSVIVAWGNHLFIMSSGGAHALAGEAYLMVIWVWLVSGLSVKQSARVMLLFLIAFVLSRPFIDIPPKLLPAHIFFLFAAALFGLIASYLTEHYRRQSFLSEERRRKMEAQFIQSQKMEAIGTLVGGIAHDFNNTLAAITGNIFLVKQQVSHLPDARSRLETVEEVSFRSAAIIKQLLAFSRKGLIHMQPVDLTKLLDTAAKLYQVSVPVSTRFEYRNDIQDSLRIYGDANQLEQVLFNLLNNARDAATGADNPTLSLRVERWQADAQFRRRHPDLSADTFARIAVSDNGCGITQEGLAHIFEPFYTTKAEGTGLGLSMAFGTIQSHGGTITVESAPGRGSTFQIYLPELTGQELRAPVAEETAGMTEAGSGTILVADDNEKVLAMVVNLLQELGYDVLQASDGEEAVELYRQKSAGISLVILDVVMPKLGGSEASRQIRRINPAASIIFMTGYDPDQGGIGEELNAEEVIMKPFDIAEFSHRIHSILAR